MVELSTLRLQDFAVFEAFEQIAERAGVEIILHGGAAFRAALYAAYQDRLNFDLFDLVPFNSDIDLEHAGSREDSARIAGYIDSLVPFASWCRWSINDGERAALARAQREASTDIPLRRIRFSTSAAADVPEAAQLDIENRRISFERNQDFGRAGPDLRPDLELFGLMLALNSWVEAEEIAGEGIAFDEGGALQWIREGLDQNALELLGRPGVAARFWHLLSLRLARCGIDKFNLQLMLVGQPILNKFGVSLDQFLDSDRAISVSKITSTADFRVPQLTPKIVTGEAAIELFGEVVGRAARLASYPQEALPPDPLDLIDPSLDLIGIVPDLTLLPYGSGKEGRADEDDPFLSGVEQERVESEFVQFAWNVQGGDKLDPHALTGQMLALGPSGFGTATALPVVGGTFGQSRAWVRARLDDLIERGKDGSPVEAVLLILQARADEAEDAERGHNLRRHSVPGNVTPKEDLRLVDSYAYGSILTAEAEEPAYETVGV